MQLIFEINLLYHCLDSPDVQGHFYSDVPLQSNHPYILWVDYLKNWESV